MFCFVSWKGAYSSIATVDVHVQAVMVTSEYAWKVQGRSDEEKVAG